MTPKWLALPGIVLLAACSVGDTSAPVPQPDSLVFGRLAAVRELPQEPGVWEVEIKAGLPDTLRAVMRREKRAIPVLEKDLAVRVRVTADTVCVADLVATDVDAFRVGQEMAVVPRPGSCAMVGTKLLLAEAAELYLFSAYQLRFLPRALDTLPPEVTAPADEARVNSAGTERTPLPLRGGKVVYFAAGLLPPVQEGGSPRGAVRAGMRRADGSFTPWAQGGCRSYRVEWQNKGWGKPQPVELADVPAEASARLTWVNEVETSCLVEVELPGKPRELLAFRRDKESESWGKPERLNLAGSPSIGDAQRFGPQASALVWTAYNASSSDLWLSIKGEPGQAVEPRINTLGPEWSPRVGARSALFFCRAERQLLFSGGMVREVRLPGKQFRPVLEAAPTSTGSHIFFRVPRFVPLGPDWDIAVAARAGSGWGNPVPLDHWRPQ